MSQHKRQYNNQEVPFEFICPISHEIMEDPVINKDSINFDRKWIQEWIRRQQRDPISRKPLKKEDLMPNKALKNLIQAFKKEKEKNKGYHQRKNLKINKMFDFQFNNQNPQCKLNRKDKKTGQTQSLQQTQIDIKSKVKNIRQQSLNNEQKCSCQIM